jgi:hypothetical protein
MDTKTIVLKTSSRGRVRTPPERRMALLAEFERSGLSAAKFAALACAQPLPGGLSSPASGVSLSG